LAHSPTAPVGAAGDGPTPPWFSVTMTVRNNRATVAESLSTILPLRPNGGELVIVDAKSTDGTKEILDETARSHPELVVISEACNRGIGRNLAVARSRAPIVLTQVDADNRYTPGVLAQVAERLRSRPRVGLIFTVGVSDPDPSVTRFYAWRREAFDGAGRYPDRQDREDPPLLLRAFRAGFGVERCVVPKIADDLKRRPEEFAPNVSPWRRSRHTMRAARRFRVLGFRFPEYVRLLHLTRRTTPRLLAGVGVGGLAYLQGALHRDGPEILEEDIERLAAVAGSSPPGPPGPR
jgi:glycosyltransferase involved in cell wall biosynthesis